MKKITRSLAIAVALLWTGTTFAAINPTTAWWNAETFESTATGTDQKTGWTNNGGSPYVMTQTLTAQTNGSATGIVLGFPMASGTTFAESATQSGGRGVYKTFANALSGYVYIKTSFYQSTSGTTYSLKNTAGTTVFEFGGNGWSSGTTLWTTATANTLVAMGTRAKWADIEFVLDIANTKLDTLNISFAGTTKSYTKTNLPAGTDIKSLYVSMTRSYCAAGLDNTTFGQLIPDKIKNLSGVSTLQTMSSGSVTSDFNVTSFTTAINKDYIIPQTNLDIVWSISDYGTLSTPDQALVSLNRSATDTRIATLTAGSISADATITLSAVYGATTITKQVVVKNLSVAGLKTGLADEIAAANSLMAATSDSNPYVTGIKSTLTGYVNAAQAVIDNASATIEEASTALSNIEAGRTTFTTAINPYNDFTTYIGTVQAVYNAEIRTALFFTTIKATLNTALTNAATARTTITNLSDISTAKSTLESALAQFNLDIPAYGSLETSLSTVVSRLAAVTPRSGDTRFLMYTTTAVTNLNSAKTTADGVLSTATTVLELTTAKTNLEAALTTFNGISRVAPASTNYYKIYTYGSDNGDVSATKSILFAFDASTLKYTVPGNGNTSLTPDNCLWQIGLGSVEGKYTLLNKATGTYLSGAGLSATAVDISLPENTSQTGLINAPTDTYVVYGIVNPSSKGLEIDVYDNVTTFTGTFLASSAIANRFRFSYQFEPATAWNGTGDWNTDAANWSFGTLPTTDSETVVQTGALTLNQTATLSKVFVLPGSTLKGTGTISGAATVFGTLEGRLNFGSDLILSGTTKIVVDGFTAGQYDVVNVIGAVTFGGVLDVTVNATNPAKGTAIQIFGFASQTGDFTQPITAPANYTFDKTTGTLTYDGTTGVSENGINEVSIYPTLSRGMITITGDATSVEIANLAGQVVKQVNLNGKSSISLAELATGAYFVKVRTISGLLKVQKVIYQK